MSSELEWQSGDFHVFLFAEFVFEGREELRIDLNDKAFHVLRNRLKVAFEHARERFHIFVPGVGALLKAAAGENETGTRDLRGSIFEQTGIEKGNFLDVLGKEEDLIVISHGGRQLAEALEESVGRGRGNLELNLHQHVEFHLKNFGPGEFVLTHGEQVFEFRRVNFFVLGGNEQRSHAENVQLAFLNLLETEVLVDQKHCDIQSFRPQSELAVHVDNPLNQKGA